MSVTLSLLPGLQVVLPKELCRRQKLKPGATLHVTEIGGGILSAMQLPAVASAQTIEFGIGTQNTTTNTVTGGIVIKELNLLEKHLPKPGKYQGANYKIDWQNFTSGPPVTNGMMANRIHIGMMGD